MRTSEDTVFVRWSPVKIKDDFLLDSKMILYCYVTLESEEIVYIGKADYCTVHERYLCKSKDAVWQRVKDRFGIHVDCYIIVGELDLPVGRRFSSKLLGIIETLLISRIKPVGNRSGLKTRRSRPGLTIKCCGVWWPLRQQTFLDR